MLSNCVWCWLALCCVGVVSCVFVCLIHVVLCFVMPICVLCVLVCGGEYCVVSCVLLCYVVFRRVLCSASVWCFVL